MKLEITDEWLLSFGEETPEPSGYITPRERADAARRHEVAQATAKNAPLLRNTNKAEVRTIAARK